MSSKAWVVPLIVAFTFIVAARPVLAVQFYDEDLVHTAGTVRYVCVEGGFYGIVGDDGKNYDPINMPRALWVDGLRVRFTAKHTDLLSFHMWGHIVELVSIEPLGDVNLDMKVDSADILAFMLAFGSQPNDLQWSPRADLNDDNVVDVRDAVLLASNYGKRSIQ